MADTYLRVPQPAPPPPPPSTRLVHVVPEGLGAPARELLANVSAALGLAHDVDVAVVAVAPPVRLVASWADRAGGSLSVVAHGLSPADLGARWTAPPYTWVGGHGARYCFAEAIDRMEAAPELKKALWACVRGLKG